MENWPTAGASNILENLRRVPQWVRARAAANPRLGSPQTGLANGRPKGRDRGSCRRPFLATPAVGPPRELRLDCAHHSGNGAGEAQIDHRGGVRDPATSQLGKGDRPLVPDRRGGRAARRSSHASAHRSWPSGSSRSSAYRNAAVALLRASAARSRSKFVGMGGIGDRFS